MVAHPDSCSTCETAARRAIPTFASPILIAGLWPSSRLAARHIITAHSPSSCAADQSVQLGPRPSSRRRGTTLAYHRTPGGWSFNATTTASGAARGRSITTAKGAADAGVSERVFLGRYVKPKLWRQSNRTDRRLITSLPADVARCYGHIEENGRGRSGNCRRRSRRGTGPWSRNLPPGSGRRWCTVRASTDSGVRRCGWSGCEGFVSHGGLRWTLLGHPLSA